MGSAPGRGGQPQRLPHPRCASPQNPAAHGVGNATGFSVPGWIVPADLGSNQEHVSARLPQASVLAAETAAGLPRADRLSSLLSHVWEWSFKSRLLAGQRLYRSHFLSLFDPSHCRGACGWLFACPQPCQSLPSQPSLTELCSTPAAKAPSQGSLGD